MPEFLNWGRSLPKFFLSSGTSSKKYAQPLFLRPFALTPLTNFIAP
jgi:hypothetical protein